MRSIKFIILFQLLTSVIFAQTPDSGSPKLSSEKNDEFDPKYKFYLGLGLIPSLGENSQGVLGNIQVDYFLNARYDLGLRLEKAYFGGRGITNSIGSYNIFARYKGHKKREMPYFGLGIGVYRVGEASFFFLRNDSNRETVTRLGLSPMVGIQFKNSRIELVYNMIKNLNELRGGINFFPSPEPRSVKYLGLTYSQRIYERKNKASKSKDTEVGNRKPIDNQEVEFKKFQLNLGIGASMAPSFRVGWLLGIEPALRISRDVSIGFRMERTIFEFYNYDDPVFDIRNKDVFLRDGTFVTNSPLTDEPTFKKRIGSYTMSVKKYYNFSNGRFFVGVGTGLYRLYLTKIPFFSFGSGYHLYNKVGFYPRVGYETQHVGITLDYNIIPFPSNPLTKTFNYLSLRYTFFIFGGRK